MKKRDDFAAPHSSAAGMAIIIVVLMIIFGGILYWMYSVRLLILPDFITDIFGIPVNDDDELIPWDTEALSGVVRSGKSNDKVEVTFDVTYENLREALLNEPKPEGIYQSVRIGYYYGDSADERRVIFMRWGDRFKVEKYSNDSFDALSETVIGDSKTVSYYDRHTRLYRSIPLPDDYYPENEAGLPSVDTLLAILAEFPESEPADTDVSEAIDGDDSSTAVNDLTTETVTGDVSEEVSNTDSRYSDCEIMLLYTENGNVYYLSFYDNRYNTREEYYISLDFLMIAEHNTYFEDELLYSCKTLSFSAEPQVYEREYEYSLNAAGD